MLAPRKPELEVRRSSFDAEMPSERPALAASIAGLASLHTAHSPTLDPSMMPGPGNWVDAEQILGES